MFFFFTIHSEEMHVETSGVSQLEIICTRVSKHFVYKQFPKSHLVISLYIYRLFKENKIDFSRG